MPPSTPRGQNPESTDCNDVAEAASALGETVRDNALGTASMQAARARE
jgi:hypothetical protein